MSSEEPKVTECWARDRFDCKGTFLLQPRFSSVTGYQFDSNFRPAILMWKEDYEAMRNERTLNLKAIHELQASLAEATKIIAGQNAELKELRRRRGMVAEAIKRRGMIATTNDLELNAVSGKRFESDMETHDNEEEK